MRHGFTDAVGWGSVVTRKRDVRAVDSHLLRLLARICRVFAALVLYILSSASVTYLSANNDSFLVISTLQGSAWCRLLRLLKRRDDRRDARFSFLQLIPGQIAQALHLVAPVVGSDDLISGSDNALSLWTAHFFNRLLVPFDDDLLTSQYWWLCIFDDLRTDVSKNLFEQVPVKLSIHILLFPERIR